MKFSDVFFCVSAGFAIGAVGVLEFVGFLVIAPEGLVAKLLYCLLCGMIDFFALAVLVFE